MAANGISTLEWKRDRQIAKLDLAAINRAATQPTRSDQYNLELLPAVYAVDNNNQADRIKQNQSDLGRPWLTPQYTESGLVTYFKPNRQLSGGAIVDQSGEGNNGTLVGATVDVDNGIFTLDGVNDYIRSANLYSDIGNPDTFSAGAWVYPTAAGVVLQITNTTTPGLAYHFSALEFVGAVSPVPNFGLWNGTGITKDTGTALTYNAWYHMVITYNGTTLKGYINGAEVASASVTYDSPHDDGETTQYLLFGAATITNMGDGTYFNGNMGEIRVYSDALTAQEVANNFNSTKSAYGL